MEEIIRERAYHLWLDSGAQDGNSDAHWLAAQREVLSVSLGELGHVTPSVGAPKAKNARRPGKKKRAA
jgi:hypothetical protein